MRAEDLDIPRDSRRKLVNEVLQDLEDLRPHEQNTRLGLVVWQVSDMILGRHRCERPAKSDVEFQKRKIDQSLHNSWFEEQ